MLAASAIVGEARPSQVARWVVAAGAVLAHFAVGYLVLARSGNLLGFMP